MPTSGDDPLLDDVRALAALDPQQRRTLAECAAVRVYAAGEALMREGTTAEAFFVVCSGAVALQTVVPGRGAVTLETLHADGVLGWSWLIPPYRAAFDARATQTTRVIAFDAACLRERLEREPALGHAVLRLLAEVFTARLRDTRLRLLDLYGEAFGE